MAVNSQASWTLVIIVRPGLAGQVEDSWGGGSFDPFAASWGAAQADHSHKEGNVGPSRGNPPLITLYSFTFGLFVWFDYDLPLNNLDN